jgi:large subunit ribosomal protein L9
MKVILLHDVAGLGRAGDVKEVANGYARNYLMPKGLVEVASPSALANLQQRVAAERRRVEKQRATEQALADRLNQVHLTFRARAGAHDRLYGSITSSDVAEALKQREGLDVDRRTIRLSEPIRTTGTFTVPIHVAPQLEATITVEVIAQEAAPSEVSAAQ